MPVIAAAVTSDLLTHTVLLFSGATLDHVGFISSSELCGADVNQRGVMSILAQAGASCSAGMPLQHKCPVQGRQGGQIWS